MRIASQPDAKAPSIGQLRSVAQEGHRGALEALAHAVNLERYPDDTQGRELLRHMIYDVVSNLDEIAEGLAKVAAREGAQRP